MPEVNNHATEATPDALMTTAEIARALRVDSRTVRRWIAVHGLPATPAGRAYRVRAGDLNEWLDRRPLHKK